MSPTKFRRICQECGEPFESVSAHAEFCRRSCRQSWNNRRMVRGAEPYDLFMSMRFDRGMAQELGVCSLLCRMAAGFRDEDVLTRQGRASWRLPKAILARRPYLRAVVLAGGKR